VIFCHIWDNYQRRKKKKKQTLSLRSGKLAILLLLDMHAEEKRKNEEDGEQESDLILWFLCAGKMKTNHGFFFILISFLKIKLVPFEIRGYPF
jgi:hypothetical protein